jgi:hypothetical protein
MLANIKTLAIGREAEGLLTGDMRAAGRGGLLFDLYAEYFPHPGRAC